MLRKEEFSEGIEKRKITIVQVKPNTLLIEKSEWRKDTCLDAIPAKQIQQRKNIPYIFCPHVHVSDYFFM